MAGPAATWLQPKLRDKRFPLQRPAGTWMGQTPSRRRAALKRSHGFRRRLALIDTELFWRRRLSAFAPPKGAGLPIVWWRLFPLRSFMWQSWAQRRAGFVNSVTRQER